MKLKSILWIALATFTTFSACTQEEPINRGEDVKDGIPTTLNITVSAEGVTSKADLADTAAETQINTLAIAVFKKEGDAVGERLDFKYLSPTKNVGGDTNTGHEGRDVYTIENLKIQTGKIQILAIANSTLDGDDLDEKMESYRDAKDYLTANKGLKEGVDATEYVFKSSELVKFADTEFKDITTKTTGLHLELTQLAARVDVSFKVINVKENENWVYTINKFNVDGIQYSSDIFLTSTVTASNSCDVAPDGTYSYQLEAGAEKDTYLTGFTFYSYERATKTTPIEVEVYGYLKTPFENSSENKNYKFKIDPTVTENGTAGLVHGHLYEVVGKIDQQTKNITFDVQIVDWSTRVIQMDADILDIHYLFVKETDIVMANVGEYFVEYNSDSDISFPVRNATYTEYYRRSGSNVVESRPATVSTSEYGFELRETEDGKTLIRIWSNIPDNYFPREITFTVRNVAGLTENVRVTQYPPQYLTAETSTGGGPRTNNDSPDRETNPNIFKITIIAAGDELLVGDPRAADGSTLTTAEGNNLISPQFIIASRQAVVYTGRYSSSTAKDRCTKYWETTKTPVSEDTATYPPGTWRMPTLAELEFLNKVQDVTPTIGYLFNTNDQYWSARQDYSPDYGWYYDFSFNALTTTGTGGRKSVAGLSTTISTGGVRCVHDVY